MSAFDRTAQLATIRRSNRRFNIMMGCIFGGAILLGPILAWIVIATEPERRAAYLAKCQANGFSPNQCTFLYAERQRQDADEAAMAALAIGTSIAASQAVSRR